MEAKDFEEFKEGKPSVRALTHAHSYPINVQCHNGIRDPNGRWCECNKGWDSAPFNHKTFNPDVHVYHMCTVWTGSMTDEQAKNITVLPKSMHRVTNIVIVSFSQLTVTLVNFKT
ncbi:uncharacterized protein CDAR_61111 [Caerostris darwini]|uniref:Uncharacterized protein n=1 Tax=Caerostris darwini TaxID=1538125 RepID=A0AAV4UTM4_9ARAC|nr:uncharacterized protein CDAR_61111 [Caerostris darwini]